MSELSTVLRAWRERTRPEEVGLPAIPGRRTPGLRREELAALATVSVDYIVRLEQGRARHPSAQTVAALARALRLTDEEVDHLYQVAGLASPSGHVVPQHISPGVRRMVDRLGDVPLAVFTATWDIIHWNGLWAAISGDPAQRQGVDRNVVWRHFTDDFSDVSYDDLHHEEFSDDLVADLRAAHARYPDDRTLRDLVTRLRATSSDFDTRWGRVSMSVHKSSRKVMTTSVGPIAIDCDVLTAPGSDLRIVVYTTAPGSQDEQRLDLLRVVGTQTLV
ncbi:helix-turn-helix transcriptional regulator [Williamsia sp.]|uniref:helix-turn-helix transcriptional regulator n=1 Tax=Williamsia sp. TaxID=1872085 RepID=UPI0025D60351|nr:helix-turn-helix transcriptional regulator [Williamsia sp.]